MCLKLGNNGAFLLIRKLIKLLVPEYAENFIGTSNCQLLETCTAVCSLLTTYLSDAAIDILLENNRTNKAVCTIQFV